MVMRVPAFRRPPRPMFRGVFPPPPYGGFPPGPPHPRFAGPPVVPPHPPAVFSPMVRAPMGVFGPPPPPPPSHFLRARGGPGGAMRTRPSFRPPKFSPYPGPSKPKIEAPGGDVTKTSNGATTNGTSSSRNGTDAQAAAVAAAQRDGIPVELIQPLYCKLCDAKLNGKLQATAHYVGKSHAKKVKQYLQNKGCTGTPTAQRVTPAGPTQPAGETVKTEADSKQSATDTLEKFCKLCDVAFTSEIQAKQHYEGRNHQRRLRGEPPLPKGFYNPATGRWQRQPPPGMAIKPTQVRKGASAGGPSGPRVFVCEPCNTNVTSEQQLNAHLQGAKHKARVSGLATAVTARVVTANAAAAAAAAASGIAPAPQEQQQQAQPFIAFVAGSNPVCVSACGTI